MGHWISAQSQVRSLAKAVSAAFAASTLTTEEKNPGKIAVADLPWQAPPLIADMLLSGAPLSAYLDAPVKVEANKLYAFWTKTLGDMFREPSRLLRRGTLYNCGTFLPALQPGQRALRFCRPAGHPHYLSEQSGVILSLEVAHAARTSLPLRDFVSDDNSYYAVLSDDRIIGVRDGLPYGNTPWQEDCSGQIPDLLRMPRGEPDYACRYDQIAALRSVLHVNRKAFPENFEALDLALQSLRVLSFGGYCPALIDEMYVAPMDVADLRVKERALRSCLEILPVMMSDRKKLQAMHDALVPEVLSETSFKRFIYSGEQFPYTLVTGRLDAIGAWLLEQYQSRVPAELQQLREQK